ncbi:MAG: DUF4296 domain-containing protein [Bacteroidia bacterium]|nr:DUF4296 domain-containing protein [Bacteroidia bacterium]
MKRAVLHIVCAVVLALSFSSCNKKGDIIPRATMSKIYAELFVADSWLSMASADDKYSADTTAFYEPVFKKFGYTTADYLASVEYYLNDPERYSRILKKSRLMLRADIKALEDQVERERLEEQARNERRSRLNGASLPYLIYKDFVKESFYTDHLLMERNENGVYIPAGSQEDKSFRGPRVIFMSDSLETEKQIRIPHSVKGVMKRNIMEQ